MTTRGSLLCSMQSRYWRPRNRWDSPDTNALAGVTVGLAAMRSSSAKIQTRFRAARSAISVSSTPTGACMTTSPTGRTSILNTRRSVRHTRARMACSPHTRDTYSGEGSVAALVIEPSARGPRRGRRRRSYRSRKDRSLSRDVRAFHRRRSRRCRCE